MSQHISLVALVVHDYDEAIQFYTQMLGFVLVTDKKVDNKRWVVVAPSLSSQTKILLAKASNAQQEIAIGNQTGGRVFLFLETDDFDRDYQSMQEKGIRFLRPPQDESYGTVAVFQDLYGNRWDLIQPRTSPQ